MYLAHAFGARDEVPLSLIVFVLGGAVIVGVWLSPRVLSPRTSSR